MTTFWKSRIMTYWPHPQGWVGGWGESVGKIFATMLLHSRFSSIWYATWPCSEKVELTQPPRVVCVCVCVWGGGCLRGKIFAIMLLHSCFFFIWYAIWPCSEKSWILTYWPHPQGRGRGVEVCRQIICYHAAALSDSLEFDIQHDHVLKKLNFDLKPQGQGNGGERVGRGLILWGCTEWFPLIWYTT